MSAEEMRGEQQLPEEKQSSEAGEEKAGCGKFALFCYLYLMQGAVSGVISTMPYTYPKLPDIETMALFHSISLPYSFKFIVGIHSIIQRPSWRSSPASNTVSARPGSWPASSPPPCSCSSPPSTLLRAKPRPSLSCASSCRSAWCSKTLPCTL